MTIEDLSARLEKVERQNRRMRVGGVGLLLLSAAGAAMGQVAPSPRSIEAQEFVVRGPDGAIAARFGTQTYDGLFGPITDPVLVLYGIGKQGSAAVLRGGGIPSLRLMMEVGTSGEARGWSASLGAVQGLEVSNSTFKEGPFQKSVVTASSLTLEETTQAEIDAKTKEVERQIAKGEVTEAIGRINRFAAERDSYRKRACLGIDPSIGLFDGDGKERVSFHVLKNGTSGMSLNEKSGKALLGLEASSNGSPSVWLRDSDGTIRAVLGVAFLESSRTGSKVETAPSSLVLFDKDGKVIERLPK